jgi:hypothetical protein
MTSYNPAFGTINNQNGIIIDSFLGGTGGGGAAKPQVINLGLSMMRLGAQVP